MKSRIITLVTATLVIAALVVPVRLVSQSSQTTNFLHYKVIDMGTFGGPQSSSPSLNALGVTAGWSATTIPKVPTSNPLVCGGVDGIGSVVTLAFEWQNGTLTNLGALPGTHNCSEPFSVNDFGVIAGTSENGEVDPRTGGNVTRAVVWKNGQIQDLGSLGGSQNIAYWINNSEQVVGWGENTVPDPFSMIDSLFFATPNGSQTRAVLWENGQAKDLGTLGGPDAIAGFINKSGQVAGSSYTSAIPNPVTGLPPAAPFLWDPPSPGFPKGRMIDLGSFGGANGFSNALNNNGQVIGGSSIASNPGACFFLNFNPGCHPFLWDNGKLIDLNTSSIGGNPLSAEWFNDAGEIVGVAAFPNAPADAYIWRNGAVTDLGHLKNDCFSHAWGINSLGQVVGDSLSCKTYKNSGGVPEQDHAFLWENGQLVDLNSLIPPNSPLTLVLTGPLSDVLPPNINDLGEIVGAGAPPGCQPAFVGFCGHAFLLIPLCADGTEGCADAPLDPAVVQASAAPLTQSTVPSADSPNPTAAEIISRPRFRSALALRSLRLGLRMKVERGPAPLDRFRKIVFQTVFKEQKRLSSPMSCYPNLKSSIPPSLTAKPEIAKPLSCFFCMAIRLPRISGAISFRLSRQ